MGCGCGQGYTNGLALLRSGYAPKAGTNGVYELFAAPGCFEPYNGLSRRESVFVVGINTDDERIFPRSDSRDAKAYARETGARFHHLPANQLCATVMTELFGG